MEIGADFGQFLVVQCHVRAEATSHRKFCWAQVKLARHLSLPVSDLSEAKELQEPVVLP